MKSLVVALALLCLPSVIHLFRSWRADRPRPWRAIAVALTHSLAILILAGLPALFGSDDFRWDLAFVGTALLYVWFARIEVALLLAGIGTATVIAVHFVLLAVSPSGGALSGGTYLMAALVIDAAIHTWVSSTAAARHPSPPKFDRFGTILGPLTSIVTLAALAPASPAQAFLAALIGIGSTPFAVVGVRALALRAIRVTSEGEPDGPVTESLVARRYRYAGPVIGQYAFWKSKTDPFVRGLRGQVADLIGETSGPVLIAGCGYGLVATRVALELPDRETRALDIDPRKSDVLAAVLRGHSNVRVETADLREWEPAPGEQYAAILLLDVLHYWSSEEQRAILTRLRRWIRPGGRLVVRDGCRSEGDATSGAGGVIAGERLARRVGFTRHFGEFHFHPESEWRALLESAGWFVHRAWTSELERTIQGTGGANRLFIATDAAVTATPEEGSSDHAR